MATFLAPYTKNISISNSKGVLINNKIFFIFSIHFKKSCEGDISKSSHIFVVLQSSMSKNLAPSFSTCRKPYTLKTSGLIYWSANFVHPYLVYRLILYHYHIRLLSKVSSLHSLIRRTLYLKVYTMIWKTLHPVETMM